jgi:ectoine hydroxylase-related dioxygenase (phytanoyl-CoA dioxygenase family)
VEEPFARLSMKPLLQDPALQKHFEQYGFAVGRLFSLAQVDLLLALYRRYIPQEEVFGLYESSRNQSYEVNREINEAIREQVELAGGRLFLPAKILGGTFMVKSHAGSEVLPLHQDWSVVEEDKFSTLFIWCPLVDVSVSNGCLFVLPGSHRYFQNLRSGTYPSDRFILPPALHRYVQDVRLQAGEAIFYSDQVFHGSHANSGSSDRIVVTARLLEKEADLVYFHKVNGREVDVYQAGEKFYLTHIDALAKGRLPAQAKQLYRRAYQHVQVTDNLLQDSIRRHFQAAEDTAVMKQLFKDAQLQAQFEQDGYVVIDFINQRQVEDLTDFYASLQQAASPGAGFQVSLDNENPDFVRRVAERLMETVRSSVDRHFQDHKIFTASFVTKTKDPRAVVPPHQDWTFVDEDRFWSATIWCPLVDVNIENGALGVIKGSHLLFNDVRPSPSPQYAPPFKNQLISLFPFIGILNLTAGQAVVFNNKTLHASPPNSVDRTRVAFGIGITHRDAAIRHYYLLPGQEKPLIEGYEVTAEFFYAYNNARLSALYDKGAKPEGLHSIGVFALTSTHYATDELAGRLAGAGNRIDTSIAAHMAAAYGCNLDTAPANGNPNHESSEAGGGPDLPFWKVYTPRNIYREIRHRLSARK